MVKSIKNKDYEKEKRFYDVGIQKRSVKHTQLDVSDFIWDLDNWAFNQSYILKLKRAKTS